MKDFLARLQLTRPLIVAPMAGGPTTLELVIATSRAGALGSLGAAYMRPEEILAAAEKIRSSTPRAFAINLFAPANTPQIASPQIERAEKATATFRRELGLAASKLEAPYDEDFDRQFEAALKAKPAALSFVFGLLSAEHVRAAHSANCMLIGTATSLDEALALEAAGVDAIVLQGYEAGGHRGVFKPDDDAQLNRAELLALVRPRVKCALIAAGGLMRSEQVAATLAAGADGVQIGTAFLACREAGTSKPYRESLLAHSRRETRITRAFSGRPARGLVNRFMSELDQHPDAILPFPAQNKFTRDIRKASAERGSPDCLSLWSGTGDGMLWTGSAVELIEQLTPSF